MSISALDENGNPVDWWFLYKVPQMSKSASTMSATGYEYVYYDPKIAQVVKSNFTLNSGQGALAQTLRALFKAPAATFGWILYNDEKPADAGGADNGSLGHTKGVIAFDTASDSALWLVHSWPKYADPGALGMPTPQYGQTFMCVSLDVASASKLAAQMADHQEPQTYSPRLPTSFSKTDPLYRLTLPLNANAAGDSDVLPLKSRGGLSFKVIAKNRKWGKDFWNDLVGPELKQDMNVETWIRGKIPPTLDSDGIHKTFDVKFIDLRKLGAPWVWPETHDHAKWGLTKGDNWICVGDINRMVTQEKRGGGTIAFQDANLWKALDQTDYIVPPPGFTADQARTLIKSTHPTK